MQSSVYKRYQDAGYGGYIPVQQPGFRTDEPKTSDSLHVEEVIDAPEADQKASYDDQIGDSLLSQIDAFREKAKQLQTLISNRSAETKQLKIDVEEKEKLLEEKESALRAQQSELEELKAQLEKRKSDSEILTESVNSKIADLSTKLSSDMERIEDRMEVQISTNDARLQEQIDRSKAAFDSRMDTIIQSIEEQESQTVPAIKESVEVLKGSIGSIRGDIKTGIAPVLEKLDPIAEKLEPIAEKLDPISEQITALSETATGMESRIIEKIHSEDVMVYRNVADLLKEYDTKPVIEAGIATEKKMFLKLKSSLTLVTCFSIVNFLVLVVYILISLGIIRM